MPDVGWLTGRLFSVPDERPSGGREDNKKIEYIFKYRSPGGHSEHAYPKITKNSRLSNNSSTSTLRQRGLYSNISKIGTANHINNSSLPSP